MKATFCLISIFASHFDSMQSKKGYLIIIFIAFGAISCNHEKAKKVTSNDIYRSYCENSNASFFNVPPGIVSLFLDESKKGNAELKDILADVKELSFLIISRNTFEKHECQIYQEINQRLDSLKFYDVAQISNSKGLIRVKVDRKAKYFNELVVLVSNNNTLYCISFKGKIHSKKVLNLVKPENVGAVANLDRFKQ